jgi:hypothetical protein
MMDLLGISGRLTQRYSAIFTRSPGPQRLLVLKTLAAVSKRRIRYTYRDLVRFWYGWAAGKTTAGCGHFLPIALSIVQSVFSLASEDSLCGRHTLQAFLAGAYGTSVSAPVRRGCSELNARGLKFSLALSKIEIL